MTGAVSLNLIVKSPDEDTRLVEQAMEGGRDAFKELFMKNVSRVYAFLLRSCCDTYLAEDLTQDVFIIAWEKLHSFQFQSKFSTWLYSIAVNRFLMYKRSEKKFYSNIEKLDNEKIISESYCEQRIDIENAISKLPEKARIVLIMHDIDGYKHNEISEMMKIESGTSKAHLHRARKLLRKELSK